MLPQLGYADFACGDVTAALSIRRFSTKIGVNLGSGDVDLSLVFHGFRFGASASGNRGSFKISLTYGAPLLHFPQDLANVFNPGGKRIVKCT